MAVKKNPQGKKPGGIIKPLTPRDKHNGQRKTNAVPDGEWRVVGGVRKFFPKK